MYCNSLSESLPSIVTHTSSLTHGIELNSKPDPQCVVHLARNPLRVVLRDPHAQVPAI